MARNGKAINVKIATTKVIKALETKLAQIQKDKGPNHCCKIMKSGCPAHPFIKQIIDAIHQSLLEETEIVKKAKAGQQAAKQQAEEAAKLSTEQQKQYNTNLKNFALLKEAIETKNLGNIQQYGIALGAKPETINEIKAEASKGGLRKAIERAAQEINLIPPTKDAAEQLRPQKPAAQSVQADEVVVELNGVQGAIPANQVDAFVKANPGAKIIK